MNEPILVRLRSGHVPARGVSRETPPEWFPGMSDPRFLKFPGAGEASSLAGTEVVPGPGLGDLKPSGPLLRGYDHAPLAPKSRSPIRQVFQVKHSPSPADRPELEPDLWKSGLDHVQSKEMFHVKHATHDVREWYPNVILFAIQLMPARRQPAVLSPGRAADTEAENGASTARQASST